MKPPFLCTLEELANRHIQNKDETLILDVPAFQRGLVWDPAQVEVLWDSLMRGIPIGSITLIKYAKGSNWRSRNKEEGRNEATHGIFDGQQRLNAIKLGLTPYPAAQSILWLDLLPEGHGTSSSRKYFFYLTTPGQPWGYEIDDHDGETRNTLLTSAERKAEQGGEYNVYEKPSVHDEWPHKAGLPIPFSIIWEIGKKENEFNKALTADRLQEELLPYRDKPWYKRFEEAIKELKDEQLEKIAAGLRNARNSRVVVIIAPEAFDISPADYKEQNSDVAVFFSRLNRGGTIPSQEDINYSILKSIAPDIAIIDTIAEGKMQASRLALIAMRFYMSKRDSKWKGSISQDDVYLLAKDEDFCEFITDELEEKIQTLQTRLHFDATARPWGMPRIVLSGLVNSNPNLYLFMLVLSGCLSNSKEDSKLLVAIGMLVGLFSVNFLYRDCYELIINRSSEPEADLKENIQNWLYLHIRRGELRLPPPPDIYTKMVEATRSMNMNEVEKAWNPSLYKHAVDQIWKNWGNPNGRMLLLYALRKYIEEKFPNYDPALSIWREDNRPWDYDHIFPQNWVIHGKGNRHGYYHELVYKFIDSIGNIAPIPYSINRSKNDNAPYANDYYIREADALFCCYSDEDAKVMPFLKEKPKMALERKENERSAFALAFWIARRLEKLYTEYYVTLQLKDLFNFTAADSKRQNLFNLFRKRVSENSPTYKEELQATYSIVYTGKQEKIESSAELSFPWLACGIKIQFPGTEMRGLLCICSNGEQVEWGIRRHPDDIAIENNPDMWWLPSRLLPDANTSELSPWHQSETLCRTAHIDQADMDQIVRETCGLLKIGCIIPCATSTAK